jgi:FMN-dependent NADH-azoreductase
MTTTLLHIVATPRQDQSTTLTVARAHFDELARHEPDGPMAAFDFQEPYLRAILGFVGIRDIELLNAQPVDVPGLRETAVERAVAQARAMAARPALAVTA